MKHLNPKEAHEFMQVNPEAVMIDCRSEMEFLFVGHPVGAHHAGAAAGERGVAKRAGRRDVQVLTVQQVPASRTDVREPEPDLTELSFHGEIPLMKAWISDVRIKDRVSGRSDIEATDSRARPNEGVRKDTRGVAFA